MKPTIKIIYDLIHNLNQKKDQWSFLTSVEYMLQSDLYMDGMLDDAKQVARYFTSQMKILDFGTGSGIFAALLSERSKEKKIFALDTRQNKSQKDENFKNAMAEQIKLWRELKKNFPIFFQHYDGLNIPFPDHSFDIITAYAVIEHIAPEETNHVLRELKRILKPNGLLFVFKMPRKLAYTEHLLNNLGMPQHEILYGDSAIRKIWRERQWQVLRAWRSNLVPEFPGKITNYLYPCLKYLDRILSGSPLKILSHHNNFILKK